MHSISGKSVPDGIRELVNPVRTALIVVDAQNDYCTPGGVYDRAGNVVRDSPRVIVSTKLLLDAARQQNVMRIFIKNMNQFDHLFDSVAQLRFKLNLRCISPERLIDSEHAIEDTWGFEVVDEIAPQAGDHILRKYRSSAFAGTELSTLLRSNGISQIVLCGVTTEGCLMSTAYHAQADDYLVVLAQDCIGSGDPVAHEQALALMRNRFDTFTAKEISEAWS